MKYTLKEKNVIAINLVNANLLLVFILSLCRVQISIKGWIFASIILSLLSMLIYFIAFNRFSCAVRSEKISDFNTTLKQNFLNFFIANIIINVLGSNILILFSGMFAYLLRLTWLMVVFAAAMYVMPFVFIQKEHIGSVIKGFRFFVNHRKENIPLLYIILSMFIVTLVYQVSISIMVNNSVMRQIATIPLNFLMIYISFFIFIMASLILVHDHGITSGSPDPQNSDTGGDL
jgi:hypothetical protein